MTGRTSYDLAVVGDLAADLLLSGDGVVPEFGQVERMVDDATLTVGGSSAICAHGAARLGLRVCLFGKVGADAVGELLLRRLSEAGVDTSAVVVDPALKTGITVHLVRGEDRAMLTYPGAMAALRPDEIDRDLLHDARHVHSGGFFLQDGLRPGLPEIFAGAREAGLTTSLDPGWDPRETWDSGLHETLAHTSIFFPNEVELRAVSPLAAEDALSALPGVPTLVVKRGAAGAVARRGPEVAACAPPPVGARDAIGAGDSFDAGFLFGTMRGYGLRRALRVACACGALSTEGSGGVDAQPDAERLEMSLALEREEHR